jgi:hypothetical protein
MKQGLILVNAGFAGAASKPDAILRRGMKIER